MGVQPFRRPDHRGDEEQHLHDAHHHEGHVAESARSRAPGSAPIQVRLSTTRNSPGMASSATGAISMAVKAAIAAM